MKTIKYFLSFVILLIISFSCCYPILKIENGIDAIYLSDFNDIEVQNIYFYYAKHSVTDSIYSDSLLLRPSQLKPGLYKFYLNNAFIENGFLIKLVNTDFVYEASNINTINSIREDGQCKTTQIIELESYIVNGQFYTNDSLIIYKE